MKPIALCFSTPDLHSGAWRDQGYGKRFPGAGWMKYLADHAMSGESVLEHLNAGAIDVKDILVVQEEDNPIGLELIERGADARVLMCLESPIFAAKFYDQADALTKRFKHSLLFDGGTEHIYFPSFDDEDIHNPVPWNDRKFLCMVTSNKHYSMLPKTDSPSFAKAMETQLHDYRYRAIEYFCEHEKKMDLFGRGWPSEWASECQDKIATIRNYKFALCFENGSYHGYVTEKIIDCLVAGVIPVYMGAPDVDLYIPKDLYIHGDAFGSFESMEHELRDPKWAKDDWKMLNRAQDWLRSPEGQRYNNRAFAEHILELCA